MSMVNMFLRHGNNDSNTKNCEGNTALIIACIEANEPMVMTLIQSGVDVNVRPNPLQDTALIAASRHGHYGMMDALLKAGADIDAIGI